MATMKNIPLILMGCGGVGRQLLQHVVSCRSLHAKLGIHLRVVGVCDSKSLVVASDVLSKELNDNFLSEVCRVKADGSSLLTLGGLGNPIALLLWCSLWITALFISHANFFFFFFFFFSFHKGECQVFKNSELKEKVIGVASVMGKSTGLAVVDCSASSETVGVLTRVVDLGCCIVLANKKPLTSTMVGAGLPVISSLNRILLSGDPIHRIIGSLSGTLGYVMSKVEDGKPLSQVVRAAKSLGYTEPDPRDDLSGMDVARKALILARLLGRRINMDSIKIESLYPEEMGPNVMSVEDFLSTGISLLDNDIQERVRKASLNGNVLRYVCMIEGSRCEVGIQELPKKSALGRLRGSDNVLEIFSRCYSEQPLVIQGAGAGNDTTAAGVLADILDIQDLFP
ncbi:hypothetical protein EZV62_002008 [Acer yangbiense]|uniref:Homoserine dehydrogenase n=1 Tax=Acer yangbiense TaxID=1000413 RepID=A0A5C7IWG6_9ROSI|nr:hypothetical protein EZV62_002008 [Acer yangbiense]